VVKRFRESAPGVEFVEPTGAFYFFFRVDGVTPTHDYTGSQFYEAAMKAGVAVVPGAAFGDDRWVRMSYAASDKDLDLALDRLLGLIAKLGRAQPVAVKG
jgi:aminotransferase